MTRARAWLYNHSYRVVSCSADDLRRARLRVAEARVETLQMTLHHIDSGSAAAEIEQLRDRLEQLEREPRNQVLVELQARLDAYQQREEAADRAALDAAHDRIAAAWEQRKDDPPRVLPNPAASTGLLAALHFMTSRWDRR